MISRFVLFSLLFHCVCSGRGWPTVICQTIIKLMSRASGWLDGITTFLCCINLFRDDINDRSFSSFVLLINLNTLHRSQIHINVLQHKLYPYLVSLNEFVFPSKYKISHAFSIWLTSGSYFLRVYVLSQSGVAMIAMLAVVVTRYRPNTTCVNQECMYWAAWYMEHGKLCLCITWVWTEKNRNRRRIIPVFICK